MRRRSTFWSVTSGSSGGTRCESTSILTTPAAWAPTSVFGGCQVGEDTRFEGRRVWNARDETIDDRWILRRVDEHIGTFGELHEVVGWRRIARNDDRPVRRNEPGREGRNDRRMIHERGGHLHVLVPHHVTTLSQLVTSGTSGRRPSFEIRTSMSYLFISKKGRVIFSSGGGPPCIDTSLQARSPREPDQISIVGSVIGVLMREKDMT